MVAPYFRLANPAHRSTERVASRFSILTLAITLGACVPAGHLTREHAVAPTFDPLAFFSGRTEGHGNLTVLTKRRQTLTVEGHGVTTGDGGIALDQNVRQGDGPVKHRTWHLRQTAPGRYVGTLSDAAGPVTGEVIGNTLHLSFMMKNGLHAQQWLYLQPGGQVSRNRMVVTKLGMPVASLDETITRLTK